MIRSFVVGAAVVVALALGGAAVWSQPSVLDSASPGLTGSPVSTGGQPTNRAAPPATEGLAPTAEVLFPDETPWRGTPAVDDDCVAMKPPDRRVKAWFTRPGKTGRQPLARAVERMICTAAPNSTIRIAMYFLKEDSRDVRAIVRALETVSLQRDVTVEFVLDGAPYAKATPVHRATLARLRDIGDVHLCTYGCRSEKRQRLPTGGLSTEIQHNKFIVITDTIWNHRLDPLLFQSSANWSRVQLSDRHQSAVMIYDDAVLAKHFDTRWHSFVPCANAGRGCDAWNDALQERALDGDRYGVEQAEGIWYDSGLGTLDGTPGRGLQVLFSPWRGAGDPMAEALGAYDCEGEHNDVWVAHLFISRFRPDVIASLEQLQSRGCQVRIIVSAFDRVHNTVGILTMRKAGLKVRCVDHLHDKIILVDAIDREAGTPRKALWIGSHSLGYDSLRRGDETLLRVTDEVSGPARSDNRALWRQHLEQWRRLKTQATRCPV